MMFFLFFGLIHLSVLTYQDIKHKKIIDDRHNWFMMGIIAAMYAMIMPPILYGLSLIVISLSLRYVINKFSVMGEGDSNTILWSFIGFGLIGWNILLFYAGFLVIIYLFMALINHIICWLLKLKKETWAGYPMFLGAFILTTVIINVV